MVPRPLKPLAVLGIMSGTSIDGVDYALCAVSPGRARLLELWTVPFPARLRKRLHAAARNDCSSHELAQLHHDLGRFYAEGARRHPAHRRARLVGLHGQTVFHHPARRSPATLQLGEPAYLAEALGVPVVSNFRAADLAAGGEGAPLATLFHLAVFGQPGRHVCVNNLGGISNVTSLDWRRGRQPTVLAFDTGPANVLLDLAMRHFTAGRRHCDADGAWARRGRPAEALLRVWLRHPYFSRTPPKSTGRELFGEPFFAVALRQMRRAELSRYDCLATFTEFTARSITFNYRRHLGSAPDRVILTGGGAANPALVDAIRSQLRQLAPEARVQSCLDLGWPLQSIEPAAFTLLAWRRWRGQPGNLPQTTGARHPALLGQLTEP
jgi:anhydro-N-acetylmuramic acid kinase